MLQLQRRTKKGRTFMAMVHCRECGEMIAESAPTCPKCGARQGMKSSFVPTNTEVDLGPSAGLNIISFIWPLIGLILYLVYIDKSPRRAKECGKWALIGWIASIVIAIIVCVIYVGFLTTLIGSLSSI